MAEDFLASVNEFIEKLKKAQAPASAFEQQTPVYKFDKDFSIELEHYLREVEWVIN